MPFELCDPGLVKLFFADALQPAGALDLLGVLRQRSEERVATLRARTHRQRRRGRGQRLSLLTLQMGIGFHQAIIDVCRDFERKHGQRPAQ